jgi:ubiquinone/menaquinone biosynthesis C-methylase UbiE
MTDPTKRFSSRVDNYLQFRPSYPHDVIDTLRNECGLAHDSVVADIGAGTGFLSELFLKNVNQVFAIEPNREMREASVRLLGNYPGFHTIDGRAEAMALPDNTIDFVVAGQSFHWFDRAKARSECVRILKKTGWMMIVWNERDLSASPFMSAYNDILREFVTDPTRTEHKKVYDTALDAFFGAAGFTSRTFSYQQYLDYEGVKGRLLSSSYTPEAGHPNHIPMLAKLKEIFQANETGGSITLHYITRMYFGRL